MSLRSIIPTTAKYYIRRNIKKIIHLKNLINDPLPKLLVLTYHRVSPEAESNLLNTIITLKTFIKQIDILSGKYPVVKLSEAINQCQSGQAWSKTQVVLTFDDGYRDNYEIVFPILKQKGLPATFFLVTDYIGRNKPLWDWEIVTMLNKNIDRIEIEGEIIHKRKKESDLSFAFRILDKMRSAGFKERQKVMDFLREHSKIENLPDFSRDSCMTWEQVKDMSDAGMEIGAHSISHRSLSRVPLEEALYEIKGSKKIIEKNTNKPCNHFAFPFGSQRDYNQTLIDHVRNAGFQTCLLNIHGYNHVKKDGFCFKRIIIEESTDLRYLLG